MTERKLTLEPHEDAHPSPKRVRRAREASTWLVRGLAVFVLVVLASLIVERALQPDPNPLASCEGSLQLLQSNLASLEAEVAIHVSEGIDVADTSSSFMILVQLITQSKCDADTLVAALDIASRDSQTASILTAMVADLLVGGLELKAVPAEVEALLAISPGPQGQPPQVVPDQHADEDMLVVFAEEHCDCFSEFDQTLQSYEKDLKIYVADIGPHSKELAEEYGWGLIDEADLPVGAMFDIRPLVIVVRNGVLLNWINGEDEIANGGARLAVFDAVLDPRAEPAHSYNLPWVGGCDGHIAGGVVANNTDRPVRLMAITDPAARFDAEGMPISMSVQHDLGVLEAWETLVFEVPTGVDVYAPCWFEVEGVYADGRDLRGTGWELQPGPDDEYVHDVSALAEELGVEIPIHVIPHGFFPSPDDVTPISSGRQDLSDTNAEEG